MNRREKILAMLAGLFVAGFLLYILIDQLVVTPAADYDAKARSLRRKISALEIQNRRIATYKRELQGIARKSFGTNELRVGNDLVKRLKYLLIRSGLNDETQALSPVTGATVTGVFKEIGRSGRASGELANAIDFLYLLKSEPSLHRLDYLTLTPKAGGRVALNFKYSTLVLTPLKDINYPTTLPAPAPEQEVDLHGPERQQYNVIVARDLFRPYIKRPVVAAVPRPPEAPPPPAPKPQAQTPPAAPQGRFKVVGLSTWAGEPEVVVCDIYTTQTRIYKLGNQLADGKIVMVDYRQVPSPDNPMLLSPSRVILQIGQDYWAIELGQTLAQKRRLKPEQLPERLQAEAGKAPPAAAEAQAASKKQT